jgi:hypothetical protein
MTTTYMSIILSGVLNVKYLGVMDIVYLGGVSSDKITKEFPYSDVFIAKSRTSGKLYLFLNTSGSTIQYSWQIVEVTEKDIDNINGLILYWQYLFNRAHARKFMGFAHIGSDVITIEQQSSKKFLALWQPVNGFTYVKNFFISRNDILTHDVKIS